MQTTRVEGHSQTFFREHLRYFMLIRGVVPDVDCLVFGTGGDKFFANTDIKTSDFRSMEGGQNVIKLRRVVI